MSILEALHEALAGVSPAASAVMPPSITVWTQADYDMLLTLTRRVRIMTVAQVERLWSPGQPNPRRLRHSLAQLARAGLLERYVVNAHPLLRASKPLVAWKPGQAEPELRAIARRTQVRWNQASRPQVVFAAGRRATCLFGADYVGLPPLLHRDHDLLLSQVYVHYRIHRPSEAADWLGEDALPKAGHRLKDPDAFLLSASGTPYRVIESAGRYGTRQVTAFHDHCAEFELPYELW